jgi:hypothetical protein
MGRALARQREIDRLGSDQVIVVASLSTLTRNPGITDRAAALLASACRTVMPFSGTRLTDAVHRRHSVSPASPEKGPGRRAGEGGVRLALRPRTKTSARA